MVCCENPIQSGGAFMKPRARGFFVAILFGLPICLAGCSTSTRLVSEWSDPGYAAPAFRRILVGGSGGGESAIRRNLEDEFVAQLQAAGDRKSTRLTSS